MNSPADKADSGAAPGSAGGGREGWMAGWLDGWMGPRPSEVTALQESP